VIVSTTYNRLEVFATGPDGTVWERIWDAVYWEPANGAWRSLGNGGHAVGAPAAVAIDGHIEIFARDSVTGHLLHQEALSHDGVFYPIWNSAGWEDLGAALFPGKPTVVVSQPGNQVNVFVTNTDGTVSTIAVSSYGSHGPWVNLSGSVQFEPGAVSWGPNRLDVFAAGGGSLFHKFSDDNGATWYPAGGYWEPLGGSVAATPAVTSWGPSRLDVVVTSGDASIHHLAYTGAGWGTCGSPPCWSAIGGVAWGGTNTAFAAPTTITTGVGNLQLFIQGTDRGLYTVSMSSTDEYGNPVWAASQKLTSCFVTGGAASVVSPDGNSLDVVATAYAASGDANVWHAETVGGVGNGMSPSQSPPVCPCGGVGQACCNNETCTDPNTEACLPSDTNSQGPWTCQQVGSPPYPCRPLTSICPSGSGSASCLPQCDLWSLCNTQNSCQDCGDNGQTPCRTNTPCLAGFVPTKSSNFVDSTCEPPCGTQVNGKCCDHLAKVGGGYMEYPICSGSLTCNQYGAASALENGLCVSCGIAGEACCNAWPSADANGTCTDGSSCNASSQKCAFSSGQSCNGTFSPSPGTWSSIDNPIPVESPSVVNVEVVNSGCIATSAKVYGIAEASDGTVTTVSEQMVSFPAFPTPKQVSLIFSLPSGTYRLGLNVEGVGTFYYSPGMCIGDDPSCYE
jgi:hypothetical protein